MSDQRDERVKYASRLFACEDEILSKILLKQKNDGGPMMNIGPDQAKFIYLLVKISKAKNVLELGSYYGYSSVWIARALAESGGILHCLELSSSNCEIIEEHMRQANLLEQVKINQGAALDLMQDYIKRGQIFDMIFIDADKKNYPKYFELAEKLLISGGILLADNCFQDDDIFDPVSNNPSVQAIRDFNELVANSPNFDSALLTIQDGLLVAIKL